MNKVIDEYMNKWENITLDGINYPRPNMTVTLNYSVCTKAWDPSRLTCASSMYVHAKSL